MLKVFITDYECDDIPDLQIDEHASIDTLNELEEDLEGLSEEDVDAINIIVNEAGYTVEEAMKIAEKEYKSKKNIGKALEEVAQDLITVEEN